MLEGMKIDDNPLLSNPALYKTLEIVYEDEAKTLCRRWNWRECDESKITKETRSAFFYLESLSSVSDIDRATAFLKEALERFLNGKLVHKKLFFP